MSALPASVGAKPEPLQLLPHTPTYTHTHKHTHTHTRTHTHIHTHGHTYGHTHEHARIYTIHTHMNTLTHTHRYSAVFSGLMHDAIWLKMLGPERFTRLVSMMCE